MSLINDALKRAKESQPATTPAPEPDQPMKPVEPPPTAPRSRGMPPYFLPAVLIVLCGACWFLIKGWETKRQAGMYPQPIYVQAREIPSATRAVPSVPAPAAGPRQFNPTDLPSPTVPATPLTPAASAATESVSEPPAVRPSAVFKLQGIFYRRSNPAAVINTKTVFIGDTIAEAKVKTIDQQSVTLIHNGQTKVLTLR